MLVGARQRVVVHIFGHKVEDGNLWRHTRIMLSPNHGNVVTTETNCDSFTHTVTSVLYKLGKT